MLQIPTPLLQQCWFLGGPTASGKSAVGILLAEHLNAEVIALDSMTLYRGMDIGTAKPTRAEQAVVPHHLFDILDPHEEFSVAEYLELALATITDILGRGRTPLFIGGTGLYLRSLLRGVFDGPEANWEYRRQLDVIAEAEGPAKLHAMLLDVDPEAGNRLHPHDLRRVIRALEVNHMTGEPLSAQHEQGPLPEETCPRHVYWLSPPRSWLHERINLRVNQMIEAGLVEEVRSLMSLSPPLGRTARQALGYKEIIDAIEQQTSLDGAIEQIKIRTRQFAKRQHTWYRNLIECEEISFTEHDTSQSICDRLIARAGTGH